MADVFALGHLPNLPSLVRTTLESSSQRVAGFETEYDSAPVLSNPMYALLQYEGPLIFALKQGPLGVGVELLAVVVLIDVVMVEEDVVVTMVLVDVDFVLVVQLVVDDVLEVLPDVLLEELVEVVVREVFMVVDVVIVVRLELVFVLERLEVVTALVVVIIAEVEEVVIWPVLQALPILHVQSSSLGSVVFE